MMFGKVKSLLESKDITQEVAEALDKEISSGLTKLKDEVKTLKLEKETLSKSYDEVLKSKGDLDAQLSSLDEKIAQAKKDGQADLTKKLEDEKAEKETLQKSLGDLQKANTTLRLDSAVSQELNKFDVKKEDRELVEFKLRASVSLDDDGKIIYSDGSSIEDGFKTYFDNNQTRLNAQGSGGSGVQDGGNGGQTTITREAFEKLNPAQKVETAKKMTIKD